MESARFLEIYSYVSAIWAKNLNTNDPISTVQGVLCNSTSYAFFFLFLSLLRSFFRSIINWISRFVADLQLSTFLRNLSEWVVYCSSLGIFYISSPFYFSKTSQYTLLFYKMLTWKNREFLILPFSLFIFS